MNPARPALAALLPPLPGEEAGPLPAAAGRVLARDLVAPLPLPPFFNSAVDGYAFRHADLDASAEATALALAGRLAAGQATAGAPLALGRAVRIFTGAPMPPG